MIRYLLDTDVVSHASKRRPNANVATWLDSVNDTEIAISVITLRERLEGAERARQQGQRAAPDIAADVEDLAAAYADRILPIDESAARLWAKLLVPERSKSDDKAQIAIAAAWGLTLVTLNAKDMRGKGAWVLNPGRAPAKVYD